MNLDQYRALKAQEQAKGEGDIATQVQQPTTETIETSVPQASEVQSQTGHTEVEAPPIETPSKVKYGEQEYDVETLIRAQSQAEALLREQDRLKAEAEKAEIATKYFNKMMENPGYAKTFAESNGLEFYDPKDLQIQQLEKQYNKVLLDKEIENLQFKHKDFDANTIIPFAVENQIKSLEDAYLLYNTKNGKGGSKELDAEEIKAQIRQELLNELKLQVNTDSLIGTSGTGAIQTSQATPQLSPAELRTAKGLKMSPEEYIKYKTK